VGLNLSERFFVFALLLFLLFEHLHGFPTTRSLVVAQEQRSRGIIKRDSQRLQERRWLVLNEQEDDGKESSEGCAQFTLTITAASWH
jgi:hypothetical protein